MVASSGAGGGWLSRVGAIESQEDTQPGSPGGESGPAPCIKGEEKMASGCFPLSEATSDGIKLLQAEQLIQEVFDEYLRGE